MCGFSFWITVDCSLKNIILHLILQNDVTLHRIA